MAKVKSSESQPISKKVLVSAREITQGMEKLRELIPQVEELMKDGIPYQEARRVKTEFQVRKTIREIFGPGSPECIANQQHRINTNNETEITKTLSMLHDLIAGLEGKKLGLLGGGHRPSPHATDGRTAKHEHAPTPVQPVEPAAPAAPDPGHPSAHLAVASLQPTAPDPVLPLDHLAVASLQPNAPDQAPLSDHLAVASLQPTRPSDSGAGSTIVTAEPRAVPTPSPFEARNPLDALGFIRKLCTRFHALVRELRLRSENRPPFDVEDEHDVRDMVRALLCLEFEDLSMEEWTPPYAGGASRTDFFLKQERIVIVVKKTRQGLGAKEIADQVAIDFQRYSIHPSCHMLLYFIYDPEGRVVNPRRLEASLARESAGRTVEVLIAPK
jgi:DpnII restriction endonuclease